MLRLKKNSTGHASAHKLHSAGTAASDPNLQLSLITQLLSDGKSDEAAIQIETLVASYPDSTNIRIAAAAVALAMGDADKALVHYQRMVDISPALYDGYFNQALILHQLKRWPEAIRILRQADHFAPDEGSHWMDCGVLYEANGSFGRAAVCYRRTLACEAENQTAVEGLARMRSKSTKRDDAEKLYAFAPPMPLTTVLAGHTPKGKKIVVVARHQMFALPLVESLKADNEVLLLNGDSPERLNSALQWADLAWFDWCDDLLVYATHQQLSCPIIARCHSYEVFTEYPAQVDWTKVSTVVFVNHSVRELFQQTVKVSVRTEVIANGLNLSSFPLTFNKTPNKKIASVGYINYKKNPALLLHCFKAIHEYDSDYSLHIAGEHQDPRIALYMAHFLKQHPLPIHFDGWISDMPSWYADKSFVISTSLFESFHFSIAEGMAMGLRPLVHDWYGAANLYPRGILFADPAECVRLLQRYEAGEFNEHQKLGRAHVERFFDEQKMLSGMKSLITQFTGKESKWGADVAASC